MAKINFSDFIGKTYNYLTIIEIFHKKSVVRVIVQCRCSTIKDIELNKLIKEETKSCGCYKKHRMEHINKIHGLAKHPLYNVWIGIRRRCLDEDCESYPDYGGRGVKICDAWKDNFKSFYDWCMANGWRKGLVIDKDIKARKLGLMPLNYSPKWCSIVTNEDNLNSSISNVFYTVDGETLTLSQLSTKYNINYETLRSRLNLKWDIEKALKTPIRKKRLPHSTICSVNC